MKNIKIFEKAIEIEKTAECKREAISECGCPSYRVLKAYQTAKATNTDFLLIGSFNKNEFDDIVKTLESGGLNEVYLFDTSKGLMSEIFDFYFKKWKKVEPVIIKDPQTKESICALRISK